MSLADALNSIGAAADTPARILVIDIERLPGTARVWDQRIRGGFIPVSQWTSLPSLLCFAAKWYDSNKVNFYSVWDDPLEMIEASHNLYDMADIVVTYNGRRFDNKHLQGAWLLNGFAPPKPWKDVDLFVHGNQFGFESRSLDHLCKRLGVQGKTGHYIVEDAFAAAEGDVPAQRRLKKYNIGDVRATQRVYDALRPWIRNHPHLGLYDERIADDERSCNKCGSTDLRQDGYTTTAQTRYALYVCQNCGGHVRSKNRKGTVATVPVK